MFDTVLPAGVLSAEAVLPIDEDWAQARYFVSTAVQRRQNEFIAGRLLARSLLARLGYPGFLVSIGFQREPVWPSSVGGSISHSWNIYGAGRVAVAVTPRQSVGIDLEPDEPLPADVLRTVRCKADDWGKGFPARLGFSAKEAFYKAIFPLTRRFLDFHEVAISVDANTLVAQLLVAAPPFEAGFQLVGRWNLRNGWVRTAFVVERPQRWAPQASAGLD